MPPPPQLKSFQWKCFVNIYWDCGLCHEHNFFDVTHKRSLQGFMFKSIRFGIHSMRKSGKDHLNFLKYTVRCLLNFEWDGCMHVVFMKVFPRTSWVIFVNAWHREVAVLSTFLIQSVTFRQPCIRKYFSWLDSWALILLPWLSVTEAPLQSWNKH